MRKTNVRSGLVTGAVLLSLIGCSTVSQSNELDKGVKVEETVNTPINTPVDGPSASSGIRFGFKLYSQILKKSEGKNVFVSPPSVGLALAMAYNGADGDTKLGMARALQIEGMSLEDVNRANAALKAALMSADPKVQLQIANSLWAKKGVSFKPEFLGRNKAFYGAEVSTLDFNNPTAAATINSWVSKNTSGKIDKIVDRIGNDTILFLINAIYFNGKWSEPFARDRTKEDTFTMGAGRQKQHPMMSQSGKYNYYEGDKFQAVSLTYGAKRMSMYIFLPAADSNLEEFHRSLTAENWETWLSKFSRSDGDIDVPRFKVEYEVELNDALKALGMGEAFDESRANFTGMLQTAERAFISKVKHKTFVEVNEEGTEAAAATSVEIGLTSAMPSRKRFRMSVDRPFFCAIRDNQTGAIVFMGSITDPL